jgi:hypothetical protein
MADLNEIAARPSGDGMPIGNIVTLPIQPGQVTVTPGGLTEPTFDDNAAGTIAWQDYERAKAYIDQNSWLMEWQYVDGLYQSPNYDRDWRVQPNRAARISRFNVAKNTRTMATQTKRAVFAEDNFFLLEPRGKLAGNEKAQLYIDAWTEIFLVLSDRADFEYQMSLFTDDQALQGTAIAVPKWEERTSKRETRVRQTPPVEINMPLKKAKVNTWASDDFKTVTETVTECWPTFEYRRLGTTLYDPGWRTPNKPELSAKYRVDIDYVAFQDLQRMRELDCYKDIPEDEDLKRYFLERPIGDAAPSTQTAQNMNTNSSIVMHAKGEHRQISENPFRRPFLKIAYWTEDVVIEVLQYDGRKKVIRNEKHSDCDHALGYSAVWYPISNSGYGFGIGRINAGDQRINQGVLNEALKMIAFPLNAPILYDATAGNAPTQNTVAGLGTFLAVHTGRGGDVRKAVGFMEMPQIPPEVWKLIQIAVEGGEHAVGADATTMQGQMGGPHTSLGRTATGAQRLASKADDNVAEPVKQLEEVITRWIQFLWKKVLEEMPIREIREILSDKFGEAILDQIDPETLLNAKFNIKILAGQKLMAKAAIAQLIPFLLQLVQQPQILQYLHQIGDTINFRAIVKLFLQVSELAGRQDLIVPLTQQQQQMVQQQQPGVAQAQAHIAVEQQKGKNKLQEEQLKGQNQLQNTIVDKGMDRLEGAEPLILAESRLARNTDMNILQGGFQ